MRMNAFLVTLFAILGSYLVFSIPIAYATTINIVFNGQPQDTVSLSSEDMVNRQVSVEHSPADITWTDVKILLTLNSATLEHIIEKIYIYKCKKMSPTECIGLTPIEFESFVNTELAWSDISTTEGVADYPQVANILTMVKLSGLEGEITWVGFWDKIKRTDYNIFDHFTYEVSAIDLEASSLDMVDPIKTYIENFKMLPFTWVTEATFIGADSLYALGAEETEIDTSPPSFTAAQPQTNKIENINKKYYFVFSNTSSGITLPLTLTQNPSFTCGNYLCENSLGETQDNCCFDCGCASEYYCDVNATIPETGICKPTGGITLDVSSADPEIITDCSSQYTVTINLVVNNPPSGLSTPLSAIVSLGENTYTTTCTGGPPVFACSVTLNPSVGCGQGSFTLGSNMINATLTYNDGPNTVTRELYTTFGAVNVNYDCSCQDNFYCDTGTLTCESESAIALGITELTSYLDSYSPGDSIELTAKIFNPPTGTTLTQASANLTLATGVVNPGTPVCSSPTTDYEYQCQIPFQIQGYSSDNSYTFDPNTLTFTITYNDGPNAKVGDISTNFGPVSIPSQLCGDGKVDAGETEESCCLDVGCSIEDDYCDQVYGCRPIAGTTLTIDAVNPTEFSDCEREHEVEIIGRINNVPSTVETQFYYYNLDGVTQGWDLDCPEDPSTITGQFTCTLIVPEITNCTLPYYAIGPNSLNYTISYQDGDTQTLTKELSTEFSDLHIIPVYHCGNDVCESDLEENATVCCIDCPCTTDPGFGHDYYCNYDRDLIPNGTCMSQADITLVIDAPTSTVNYDSCEKTHRLNVKAHIENKPSSLEVESEYADLNGSDADIDCIEEIREGFSNTTYNCTLIIPSVYECIQGETHDYSPNAMHFYVSYEDGMENTLTQTLSADLPDIRTTQSIRSRYDIIHDAIEAIKMRLEETLNIMYDLLDWYKSCIEWVIVIGIILLIGVIAGSIAIGFGWGQEGGAQDKWSGSDFADAIGGLAQGWGSIFSAMTKICEMVRKFYEIAIKIQEMEIAMIQMLMCLELYQHDLDAGDCDRDAESCFREISSCVNFDQIDGFVDDISDIGEEITTLGQGIGTDVSQAGQQIEEGTDTSGGGKSTLTWQCNGYSCGNVICEYKQGATTESGGCEYTVVTFLINRNGDECSSGDDELRVRVDDKNQPTYKNRQRVLVQSLFGVDYGDHTFTLYCDKDGNNVYSEENDDIIYAYDGVVYKEGQNINNQCTC